MRSLRYIDVDAILQETELLQPLTALERRLGKQHEGVQRRLSVGIKTKVFEVSVRSGLVAVVRDGRAGKIQCFSVERCYHLNGVWIVPIMGRARRHHGR